MPGTDVGADQGADLGADQGGQFPPQPPTSLVGLPGDGQVSLSWTGQPDAASYNAYRAPHGGAFAFVGSTGSAATAYTDPGLADGTAYDYYVTALGVNFMESQPSNIITATPAVALPNAPTTPAAASAFATVGGVPNTPVINLTWAAPSGGGTPTSYEVFRGATAGAESATALQTGIASNVFAFQDQTANPGTVYYYTIKARDASGDGAASSEVTAKTACLPPVLQSVSVGDTTLTAVWAASVGATGYNAKIRTPAGSGNFATVGANVQGLTYTFTGLTDGVASDVEITALD